MKIAAVSDDGITISQHFGRARFYVVLTIEDGKVVAREQRDKMGHAHFASEPHEEGADPRGHGYGAGAHGRHVSMAAAIQDCEVLLARGMGAGAYESMQRVGIRPIVTDAPTIDEAAEAFIKGDLVDHTEKLH